MGSAITNQVFTIDKGDFKDRIGNATKKEIYAVKPALKVAFEIE